MGSVFCGNGKSILALAIFFYTPCLVFCFTFAGNFFIINVYVFYKV